MTKLTAATFAERVGTSVQATATKRVDSKLGRFYQVDEDTYPSVTHILQVIGKPALINWAANQERVLVKEAAADLYADLVKLPTPLARTSYLTTLDARIGKTKAHQKELAKAGDIGTEVHALIEWRLRNDLGQATGPEPRVHDDAQWAFMAYEDWAKSVSLKPLFIEQMVFSRVHGYAGTMDLLAEVSGRRMLVDFKTGKAVYPEASLQNVAYQVALSEMGHGTSEGGLIVRLPKVQTDPAFEVVEVKSVEALFPTFLAVKDVWRWWYEAESAYRARQKEGTL